MLLKISKLFLCVATLSVLVVLASTFFPFIGGKYYFFRVAVELALAAALLWWAFEASDSEEKELYRRLMALKRKPLVIAVSVFALTFLLATFFANDPHGAFWSNFERGEGGFQMLHYYAFFALLVILFDTKRDWEIMFAVSTIAAILMILYGVLGYYQQYSRARHAGQANYAAPFCSIKEDAQGGRREACRINFITAYQGNVPPTFWLTLVAGRFQGSLGNPAYVAPYLLFALFYAAYLASASRAGNAWFAWFKWISFGILAAFFLFFFAASQTRGAFFGLAAGVYAFLVYTGLMNRRRRILALILIAAGVIASGTLVHLREYTAVAPASGAAITAPLPERTITLPRVFGFLFPHSGASAEKARLLDIIPGGRFFDVPLQDKALWALGVGAFLFASCAAFLGEKKYRRWASAALAALVIAGAVFAYREAPRMILAGKSDPTAQTVQTRFWTWGSAWQGFKDRPLLGWGPENFSAAFDKYFDTRHYVPGTNAETWFDRAHSVFFDYLAEIGLLGFLAYVGMFTVFFWHMARIVLESFSSTSHAGERRVRENAVQPHEAKTGALPLKGVPVQGLLLGIVTAYLVQGAALFDVLPIYINLFIILAFSCYYVYALPDGVLRRHALP